MTQSGHALESLPEFTCAFNHANVSGRPTHALSGGGGEGGGRRGVRIWLTGLDLGGFFLKIYIFFFLLVFLYGVLRLPSRLFSSSLSLLFIRICTLADFTLIHALTHYLHRPLIYSTVNHSRTHSFTLLTNTRSLTYPVTFSRPPLSY